MTQKYVNYSRHEAAQMLILEQYAKNLLNDKQKVVTLTHRIYGNSPKEDCVKILAMVNALVELGEIYE